MPEPNFQERLLSIMAQMLKRLETIDDSLEAISNKLDDMYEKT